MDTWWNGKNAEGEIIEILENVNQAGVDMLSVIKEFDLPNEFPSFVKEEAESIPQEINKEDIKSRKDLRDNIIFTNNSITCDRILTEYRCGANFSGSVIKANNYILPSVNEIRMIETTKPKEAVCPIIFDPSLIKEK